MFLIGDNNVSSPFINPYLMTHYCKYLLIIVTITIRNACNTLAGYKMAGSQSSPVIQL